jgi:hypothetical protein
VREVRFQVASVHREGERLFVGGRNCEDALALGDVVRGPDGDVRVEAILTYRRYVNTLDRGLTGEIELSGDGTASIQPGCDLVGTAETELPPSELLGEGEFHVKPA